MTNGQQFRVVDVLNTNLGYKPNLWIYWSFVQLTKFTHVGTSLSQTGTVAGGDEEPFAGCYGNQSYHVISYRHMPSHDIKPFVAKLNSQGTTESGTATRAFHETPS